jgi:hypothetical protein
MNFYLSTDNLEKFYDYVQKVIILKRSMDVDVCVMIISQLIKYLTLFFNLKVQKNMRK